MASSLVTGPYLISSQPSMATIRVFPPLRSSSPADVVPTDTDTDRRQRGRQRSEKSGEWLLFSSLSLFFTFFHSSPEYKNHMTSFNLTLPPIPHFPISPPPFPPPFTLVHLIHSSPNCNAPSFSNGVALGGLRGKGVKGLGGRGFNTHDHVIKSRDQVTVAS